VRAGREQSGRESGGYANYATFLLSRNNRSKSRVDLATGGKERAACGGPESSGTSGKGNVGVPLVATIMRSEPSQRYPAFRQCKCWLGRD
jgi:hypothetical protein